MDKWPIDTLKKCRVCGNKIAEYKTDRETCCECYGKWSNNIRMARRIRNTRRLKGHSRLEKIIMIDNMIVEASLGKG